MRRSMTALALCATVACGESDREPSPPAQAPTAEPAAPPPAPRVPTFPVAEQFSLGESVAIRGGASTTCQKLYYRDEVIAIVETWIHTGNGAVARRCIGSGWADPESPTPSELGAAGALLDGRLAVDFVGLGVDANGALTFTSLGLAERASELSIAGRWAAYVRAGAARDAASGGLEADAVGVVYDLPGRVALQEFLLGTCTLRGSDDALAFDQPTWSEDGRAVTFHGIAGRCSFEEVETHPE